MAKQKIKNIRFERKKIIGFNQINPGNKVIISLSENIPDSGYSPKQIRKLLKKF